MADEEKRPEGEETPTQESDSSAAPADAAHDSEVAADEGVSSEEQGVSSEEQSSADETPTEAPPADEPADATPVAAPSAAAHADHGHDDEHFGHVAPMKLLLGVLGALLILTVLTVAVTAVDLGGQWNFIVAMIVATIKAALVMGYFMHLVWDSKFNVVVFLSSFLFVLLFLSMAVLDRGEYAPTVQAFENDQVEAAE